MPILPMHLQEVSGGKHHFHGHLTVAATIGGVLVASCVPGLLLLFFCLDERDAYLAKDGDGKMKYHLQ